MSIAYGQNLKREKKGQDMAAFNQSFPNGS
jgi:hypothetical protein